MKYTLKEIATISAGQGAPQGDNNYSESGIPFVKAGNLLELIEGASINDIQKVSDDVAKKHRLKLYPKGTILFAKSGMSCLKGYVYILPCDSYVVSHLACVTPHENISQYLKYYFDYNKPNKLIKDAAYPSISLSDIGELIVDIKDCESRKNIVSALSEIEMIIFARKQQLAKLDELVKARFVEMFGTIHDNKFGYEIKTLQDVCEQIKDGTHQTPIYTDDNVNGYKFLSSKDVTTGKIDWTHLKYIPEELHNELYARIAPKKGDILLAKNGTTGIAAIVDRDEVFDIYVSLALLRPIEISSVYLWAAINSVETKQQFDSSLKGIGVPNLHLGEIKKAKIIIPPVECQNQFAAFVEQVDKSKLAVQKALDEAQTLFDSLMQQYFG